MNPVAASNGDLGPDRRIVCHRVYRGYHSGLENHPGPELDHHIDHHIDHHNGSPTFGHRIYRHIRHAGAADTLHTHDGLLRPLSRRRMVLIDCHHAQLVRMVHTAEQSSRYGGSRSHLDVAGSLAQLHYLVYRTAAAGILCDSLGSHDLPAPRVTVAPGRNRSCAFRLLISSGLSLRYSRCSSVRR